MRRGRKASEDFDASDMELLEDDEENKADEDQQRFFSILKRASSEQLERYEIMHGTYLYNPKDTERFNERFEGIVRNFIGSVPTEDMLIIVAAAAKIYIGELVEMSLQVSKENGEIGQLAPVHLQEARRRLKKISKRIL